LGSPVADLLSGNRPGIGVSKYTIYDWKAKYSGLEVNEAEELVVAGRELV
jgi:hypothetical protein